MKHYLTILLFVIQSVLWAQTPKNPNPSEIYHRLQKLNTLGSALYIAAHPDDENTKLISYLSNHHQAETSYRSEERRVGKECRSGCTSYHANTTAIVRSSPW